MKITNETLDRIREQVGWHDLDRVNTPAARTIVEAHCPAGWRCCVQVATFQALPAYSVCVGQIRTHNPAVSYWLYVYPEPELL